jgi:ferric-dicitrate binding protein FerR (iron transport regulator)
MELTDPREIAKKLMQETLTSSEQETILHSAPVTEYMQRQWETAPDIAKSEHINGRRTWRCIRRETFERISAKKIRRYQIVAWAASFLLLISMAGSGYFLLNKNNQVSRYIVNTGIQNIGTFPLPDGTIVQLGAGSKLTYPENFNGQTREIWLDGQAFFDVSPDKKKPFIVHTSRMDVEALGTAFEIFAYNTGNHLETVLLNGKIKVNLSDLHDLGDAVFTLEPNDKIVYNTSTKETTHSKVNAENYTAWRKGVLSFENEKLSMIIPRLEQWYGRKIFVEKELGEAHKFTFKVRDEPLDRILYIMGESSPIRYRKMDDGNFTLFLRQ